MQKLEQKGSKKDDPQIQEDTENCIVTARNAPAQRTRCNDPQSWGFQWMRHSFGVAWRSTVFLKQSCATHVVFDDAEYSLHTVESRPVNA